MNSKKKKYKNYTKALIKLSYKQFKFALNKMRRKKKLFHFISILHKLQLLIIE